MAAAHDGWWRAERGDHAAVAGDGERSTAMFMPPTKALLNRPDALPPVLPTIEVPTLLLSGSEDTWSPVSQHETMRRRIPHATLFEIHGAGHMAPFERARQRSPWRCANG